MKLLTLFLISCQFLTFIHCFGKKSEHHVLKTKNLSKRSLLWKSVEAKRKKFITYIAKTKKKCLLFGKTCPKLEERKKRVHHTLNGKYRYSKKFKKWTKQLSIHWKKSKKDKSCKCGIPYENKMKQRIISGIETDENALPWMVSLQDKAGSWYCGGSIITSSWIITAAHCVIAKSIVDNPKDIFIKVGDHDLKEQHETNSKTFLVSEVHPHEDYHDESINNDIALLKLKNSIKFQIFQGTVGPICLPKTPMKYYGEKVKVAGWGLTETGQASTVLKQVEVTLLWMKRCRNDFKYDNTWITNKMMCGMGKGVDSCQGDSGGPIIFFNITRQRYEQVGVVSWGIGCGKAQYPGVYTKLSHFLVWILKLVRKSSFCSG